jgi:hypothetical protein
LVTRRAVVARQAVGFLVDPGDGTDRKAVGVKLLVSEAHWLYPPFLDPDPDPDFDFDFDGPNL